MGIKDLLKNLEDATVQKNISDFAGKSLAIDASGWLHKAVYTTAEDWIESNCADSQLYVDVIITRLKQLQALNITPVMVFDGKRNTLKSETNAKREEGRIGNMENARRLLESIHKTSDKNCRDKMRAECIACLQRGLGATHEMEKNLLAALRKYNIDTIVAPYEADPQLAYLCHIGYCHGVLSEDSDILVYSAVSGTPFPVLCKYEARTGAVQITDLQLCGILGTASTPTFSDARGTKFTAVESIEDVCFNVGVAAGASNKRKNGADAKPPALSFVAQLQSQFKASNSAQLSVAEREANVCGRRMFVQLCLLAGCDYSDSIPGVGLLTALQAIIRFRDIENNARLKRVCDYFKLSGKKVADNYQQRLLRAEQLFYYHPVYNPYTDGVAHFTEQPMETSDTSSVGANGAVAATSTSVGAGAGGYPVISELELQRLGGDVSEVLSPAKRDSPDARPGHSGLSGQSSGPVGLTIHDVCRGRYSIKDHAEIAPRYPWERLQQGRLVSTEASGRCTGWYMRRTLMNAVNQQSQSGGSHNLYAASAAASGGGSRISTTERAEVNTGRSLISTFMLPRSTAPRAVAPASTTDVTVASRGVTSSYFNSSARGGNATISPAAMIGTSTGKISSPPSTKTVTAVHRFAAFDLLSAPSNSAHRVGVDTKLSIGAENTTHTEMAVAEAEQSVYDLQDDEVYADHGANSEVDSTSSAYYSSECHAVGTSLMTRFYQSGGPVNNADGDAESVVFEEATESAPTVYDVMDSPQVVNKRSVHSTTHTTNDAREDSTSTVSGGILVDLCAESPVAASAHIVTPTLSRVGQNPFKTAPPVQPGATVKKFRPQVGASGERCSGSSIQHAFSVSAQVHRKTLGAASFVPIQRPPLDESVAATSRYSNNGSLTQGSESGVKRKVGTFAPVQVPRKKLPNVQSSGSILVPSIKSFFSAV